MAAEVVLRSTLFGDLYGGHVSAPPSRHPNRRRLFVAIPGAVLAALVSVLCVLVAFFFGGVPALLGAFIAAVAGAVWGACLILAIGDRAWR